MSNVEFNLDTVDRLWLKYIDLTGQIEISNSMDEPNKCDFVDKQ